MREEANEFMNVQKNINKTYWWLDVEEVTMKSDFNQGIEAFRDDWLNLAPKISVFTHRIGLLRLIN